MHETSCGSEDEFAAVMAGQADARINRQAQQQQQNVTNRNLEA